MTSTQWLWVGKLTFSAALIAMAYYDLRTRMVPAWLTHPLLVIIAMGYAMQGDVASPLLLLALVAARRWVWGIAIACMALTLWMRSDMAQAWVAVAWLVIAGLWRMHWFGGGDAKLFMILFGLFPDVRLLQVLAWVSLPLSIGWTLWLRCHHRPKHNSATSSCGLAHLRIHGQPVVPMYVAGALVYVWWLT